MKTEKTKISKLAIRSVMLLMTSKNVVESFRFFKQRKKLYFLIVNIQGGKHIKYILLRSG